MTTYNERIRTALARNEDFDAHTLILQQEGRAKGDAKFAAWSAGPDKGRADILQWMQDSATTAEEIGRPDLSPELAQ